MRIDYSFHFDQLPLSSFHLNQCTLFPDSFDQESLFYATHNGGYEYEEFLLNKALKHYQHSSSVVSASHALGATEGITVLGDQSTVIAIITDRSKNGSLPMIEHRITNFGRYFTRLVYSLGELDESRKMQNELFGEYSYDFVIFNQ